MIDEDKTIKIRCIKIKEIKENDYKGMKKKNIYKTKRNVLSPRKKRSPKLF